MYFYAVRDDHSYDDTGDKRVRLSEINDFFGVNVHSYSCRSKFTIVMWRKAHIIHEWFVENVQSGNDDCGNYYVSRSQIKDLIFYCKSFLDGQAKLSEQQNTEYVDGLDHYYLKFNFEKTIEKMEQALQSFDDDWMFEYASSW